MELDALCSELTRRLDESRPHDLIEVIETQLLAWAPVRSITVWITDHSERRLVDMANRHPDKSVVGSVEGRCFSLRRPLHHDGAVHVPITRRRHRLGVLSVEGDVPAQKDLTPVGTSIAHALDAASRQSDFLTRVRGGARLSLPATIQHQLLPPGGYESDELHIGGQIEPAYDIAGDAFDYSVDGDGAYVGIFDAVGHGLRATLISSVVVGAFRRARLVADSLDQLVSAIDRQLSDELDQGEFVTGLVARLDLESKRLYLWNAGHLPPVLVRGNEATALRGRPTLPFGLGGEGDVLAVDLQPGDLMVMYTDGVVQARDSAGGMLGEPIVSAIAHDHRELALDDFCQVVLDRVNEHVGRRLSDDATVTAVRIPA